jgi:murein DD-endopeptidase MepM/ murein hydrolase activator NlpD
LTRAACITVTVLVLAQLSYVGAAAAQSNAFVITAPAAIAQGGVAEVELNGPQLEMVKGRFGKQEIVFSRAQPANFSALLGVDLEAKPGPAKLHLSAMMLDGSKRNADVALSITPQTFPQESFTVAAEFDQLTPDVLERVRREQEQFTRAFSASSSARLWESPFIMPVQAGISSAFGYRRIINGIPRAPHTGVDLRVPMATPVRAANSGRVALVGEFFYSGKTVVVDHGARLFTLYFHLSEFNVREKSEIQKGDLIGLSGMTGRVTGPHLHWGARLNDARIDPFELLKHAGAEAVAPNAVGAE